MAESFSMTIRGPDGSRYAIGVQQNLGKMQTDILPKMWNLVVRWFGEVVMGKQFQTEGGYLGSSKWKSLDPAYREWKTNNGMFSEIGRREGFMWQAFTNFMGPNGFYEVHDGGMAVTFGAAVFSMGVGSARAGSMVGFDYAEEFNKKRPLFGNTLPLEVENQLRKITAMAYALAMRVSVGQTLVETGTMGRSGAIGVEERQIRADGKITKTALSEWPAWQIDNYIDDLIVEMGGV
jgi:hypothetical protein